MENIKYQTLIQCFLFSVFFLLASWVFAQDSDQSLADSGVLVSSPNHTHVVGQDSTVNNGSNDDGSSQNMRPDSSDSPNTSNPPTDEIVVKATDAVIFQMTANLKLTQDQISAVRPIITDNIVRVRKLQQSLQDGTIDSKAMYDQRLQLTEDEDRQLSHILSADQLKLWVSIQGQ